MRSKEKQDDKQQALSRKKKGSINSSKSRKAVSKLAGKIRDRRQDYLHKKSMQLVSENQVICAENLSVKKMMKNKRLARSIADAGWGTLLQFLQYKSEWYGRQFVQIDRYFPSSKLCFHCKNIYDKLSLSDRIWTCPTCGTPHDRDTTAAVNIKEEGLRAYLRSSIG